MPIAWTGAMSSIMNLGNHVLSRQMQCSVMSIYVLTKVTHVAMENVFHGGLEWHFND
jgi:hypothetical protein